jgi:hypothetical protein
MYLHHCTADMYAGNILTHCVKKCNTTTSSRQEFGINEILAILIVFGKHHVKVLNNFKCNSR